MLSGLFSDALVMAMALGWIISWLRARSWIAIATALGWIAACVGVDPDTD